MKRMYSKEELVELLIKQEGSSVTVDSELSDSSENPVQNKVIKDALDDKQDSLPTVVNDRFLHTNADTGALEWAEAGGGGSGKYLHLIHRWSNNYDWWDIIVNDSQTPISWEDYVNWIKDNGFNCNNRRRVIGTDIEVGVTGSNKFEIKKTNSIYWSYVEEKLRHDYTRTTYTFTTDGSSVTVTRTQTTGEENAHTGGFLKVYVYAL